MLQYLVTERGERAKGPDSHEGSVLLRNSMLAFSHAKFTCRSQIICQGRSVLRDSDDFIR